MLAGIGERASAACVAQRRAADDSGIAGSVTRHVYPYPLARWLAHGVRRSEIDWRNVDDPSLLDGFVGALLARRRA